MPEAHVRAPVCREVQSSSSVLSNSKFQAQGWRFKVGVGGCRLILRAGGGVRRASLLGLTPPRATQNPLKFHQKINLNY